MLQTAFKSIFLKEDLTSMNYIVFCDLDGVLADFEKGMSDKGLVSSKPKSWKFLDKKFWEFLPFRMDGRRLWDYLIQYTNPIILTAIPDDNAEEAEEGKRAWVRRELGSHSVICCKREEKQDYASKQAVLIDDDLRNVREWRSKNGIGIAYSSTTQTIKELESLGLLV